MALKASVSQPCIPNANTFIPIYLGNPTFHFRYVVKCGKSLYRGLMYRIRVYLCTLFLSLFVVPQLVKAQFQKAENVLQICLDLDIDEQKVIDLKHQIETTLIKDGVEIKWSKSCAATNDGIWVTAWNPVTWDKKLDESTIQFNVTTWPSDLMADISSFLISDWDQTKYLIEYPAVNSDVIPILTDSVAGMGLLTINQCSKAQEHFSKVQSVASKSNLPTKNLQATIAFYQGNCAIRQKNYDAARDYFISSMTLPSERIGPNYAPEMNLVWSYWKLDQTDVALKVLNKDIETTQDYLRPFHILKRAEFYVLLARYGDAINDYNTAISQIPEPVPASVYLERGQTFLLLYEWDNVLADYNKALELDPTYADAYYYRAVLKYSVLQTGQSLYSDALADFQHYLELDPAGDHAADASRYTTDIQTQLAALNN